MQFARMWFPCSWICWHCQNEIWHIHKTVATLSATSKLEATDSIPASIPSTEIIAVHSSLVQTQLVQTQCGAFCSRHNELPYFTRFRTCSCLLRLRYDQSQWVRMWHYLLCIISFRLGFHVTDWHALKSSCDNLIRRRFSCGKVTCVSDACGGSVVDCAILSSSVAPAPCVGYVTKNVISSSSCFLLHLNCKNHVKGFLLSGCLFTLVNFP